MSVLSLARLAGESIMIGKDVEVKIVAVGEKRVRLSITAPPHVAVHRKEIWEAIQREKGKDNG